MLNSVTLMGRLVRAPELRHTQSGLPVLSVAVAVERDFSDKSSGKRETDFIDIVAWRNTADFIYKYFNRGDMIAVSGRLQTRKYQDKQGNNRTAVEVLVDSAYFCGSKRQEAEDPVGEPQYIELNDDGDIPF